MVAKVNLSPDPSKSSDSDLFQAPEINLMPFNSDSEEEEFFYEGYEVLPQDFPDGFEIQCSDDQEESEESDVENINIVRNEELLRFDQSTKFEVTELWNLKSNRLDDIVMDSKKAEEIKNAMAGFILPPTAVPPWAKNISEKEWKEELLNRVNLLKKGAYA